MIEVVRSGTRFTAHDAGGELWSVELGDGRDGNPFREAVHWPAAGVVAIGLDQRVVFVAADSGMVVSTLTLGTPDGGDFFGHLAIGDDATLYVLGWRDVVAVAPTRAVRWIARGVAIDGIIWREQRGDHLLLDAEMDPPGGWVSVVLDATTGRPVER
ncbi:MAG: hypothetical protein JNK64_12885 [Myxococcales bacterium]|nr:hypothetical protein [Myxococcales bacterium]